MLQRNKCEATSKALWEGYQLIEHTRPMDIGGVINISVTSNGLQPDFIRWLH